MNHIIKTFISLTVFVNAFTLADDISTLNEKYKKSGNYPPVVHRLSQAEEAVLLKDVQVPKGFTKTLFAPWQMANYPTYVAAAPNGDLYVSSDGNASGGREKSRGRVIRLRDNDGDGRADEVKEFIKEIDSPRGIIWDHDRLYVLHPPHISVFHDKDGDGFSESSERLISNIAFDFQSRSADHTTNGLEMGVDGWIYVAVGDFGFMKASGTDGRELQLRGGGVVRFRPDGSGLELFSSGTRNIYGLAITPTLDMISRDNTNDGGGWDVRLHQHTGLEDHGYPRLYMNFKDEIIAPLADYGGGSGVGAFYLGEPGIPGEWNNRPYTCDWGRQGSYRHILKKNGTVFKETQKPEIFIKMTRPVDADVDGLSNIYQASWKGPANYFWKGVNQGYIAKISPVNFKPETLPDFKTLTANQLVNIISKSSSHIRRVNAQRMLIRKEFDSEVEAKLLSIIKNRSIEIEKRVTALYGFSQRKIDSENIDKRIQLLCSDVDENDPINAFITRALGDLNVQSSPYVETYLKAQLESSNPVTVLEAIITVARLNQIQLAENIVYHLGSSDPIIFHTAFQALAKLKASSHVLKALNSKQYRKGASLALMRMHDGKLVDDLLILLRNEKNPEIQKSLVSVVARLYHVEAEWQGDSWSTRPDTRGPYYQLALWEKSEAILKTLNEILESPTSSKSLTAHIVSQLGVNRIQNDRGLNQILKLAQNDSSLLPTVLNQLAGKDSIPPQAVPLVLNAAMDSKTPAPGLKQAVQLLLNIDHPKVFPSLMAALSTLSRDKQAAKVKDDTRKLLLNSPKL